MSPAQRPLVARARAESEICEDVIDSPWLGERIRVTDRSALAGLARG